MTQSGPAMAKPIVWRPTCSITRDSRRLELACYYHERWEEELVFDEQKTHQDPRRPSKPTHLRSQTPAGVEQELYALSLGHFVVRALMLEAAQRENLDVDRLSFTGCLQILQARLPECDSTTSAASGPMVSTAAGGDGPRAGRAAPQPSQPACSQTQDVQVRQETPGTSAPTALEENLCRDCSYYLTNGIGAKQVRKSNLTRASRFPGKQLVFRGYAILRLPTQRPWGRSFSLGKRGLLCNKAEVHAFRSPDQC